MFVWEHAAYANDLKLAAVRQHTVHELAEKQGFSNVLIQLTGGYLHDKYTTKEAQSSSDDAHGL